MKKKVVISAILILAFFFVGQVYALEWHTANQTTVAWDPVTVESGTVQYEVFMCNADTDPNKTNPISVWRGPETQALITLSNEGQYYVGVRTWRVIDASTEIESEVAWSDDPQVVGDANGDGTPDPFGIRYFVRPSRIGGLHPVSGQ